MKKSALFVLIVGLAVLSAPLVAQTPEPADEPSVPQPTAATADDGAEGAGVTEEEAPEEETEEPQASPGTSEPEAAESGSGGAAQLPKTASPLAMFVVLGLAAGGSALSLRALRRR